MEDEQIGWLAHPVLLGAVAVLVANDHWAKGAHPGWVTGKLSDVAGVVVVGTLLAVLLGRWTGMVACATAFAALKTVPGVAELAAPLLGGVTLRDATDLLALSGLGAVLLATRRPRRAGRTTAVLAGAAAVLATTATGSLPELDVSLVGLDGTRLVAHQFGVGHVESADGGRTWTARTRGADGADAAAVASIRGYMNPGPSSVCRGDGSCFRVARTRDRIERRGAAGAPWTTDLTVTPDLVQDDYAPAVHDPGTISLSDIAVVPVAGSDAVVASFGVRGVLVRERDGTWTRHPIGKAMPRPAAPAERVLATLWFPALVASAAAFVLVTDRPRRARTRRRSLVVLVLATLLVLGVELMSGVMPGLSDPDIRRAWLTGAIVVIGAFAAWARRRDSQQVAAEQVAAEGVQPS